MKSRITNFLLKLYKTGMVHIFSVSVINKVITFMSSILLVRILTKEEYGVFTYSWNIYHIVLLFNAVGLSVGALQLASERGGINTKKIFTSALTLGIIIDFVIALVLFFIGQFATLKIEGSADLLKILSLLPFFQFVFDLICVYYRSKKKNREYSIIMAVNTLLVAGLTLLGAILYKEIGLIISYYVAYFLTFVFATFMLRKKLNEFSFCLDTKELKLILPVSLVSMITNALSQVLYLLDTFIIGIICPDESIIANYKVATIVPTALVFIPTAMVTYIFPYFAEHKDDKSWCKKKYYQVLLAMALLNLIITITLYFTAPFIIKILYGDEYMDALPIFKLLVLNYFVSGTFRIISGNILSAQRRYIFNLVESIISSILNIILDIFFIQWWGDIGAAYATMIVVGFSSILSTAYLLYTFRKKRGDNPCQAL